MFRIKVLGVLIWFMCLYTSCTTLQ